MQGEKIRILHLGGLAVMVLFLAALPAFGQESPLIFGSDLVQTAGDPTNLYRIDLEARTSTVLGTFGDEFCVGLEIHSQGLYSICSSDGDFYLVRLDQEQPAVLLFPAYEDDESPTYNAPRDFLLTDDAVIVVNLSSPDVPILPPAVLELRVHSRDTGDLISRRAPTQIVRLSTDPSDPDRPYALFRDQPDFYLGRLDLVSFVEEPELLLPGGFAYRDVSFDASSGDFLAIVKADSQDAPVEMARIRLQPASLELLFETSQRLSFLEVNNPASGPGPGPGPDEIERIAPILVGSLFSPSQTAVSTLTLYNHSATAQGSASLAFFDNRGNLIANRLCSGSLPVQEAFPVPPSHLLSAPLDTGRAFAGWARVRTQGPVRLMSEVAFIQGIPFSCDSALDEIPSVNVQTAVEIPLVEPGRSFSAPATITQGRESAFAIVNPDPLISATVEIEAVDQDGVAFDFNEVVIGPRQRLSMLLFEWLIEGKIFLVPPQRPDDYRGLVRIRSDQPVAVAGLTVLLPEGKWSNLPVTPTELP